MWIVSLAALAAASLRAEDTASPSNYSSHFVTVDKDVKLEVVDWGGPGRPLILLGGLGATAHVFDAFAPKLAAKYHVYGITRRGFGASSVPASGYSADRLGDDVLAVIDALKINRPVLVGHSMAGEELSSVGSRHPEKVAGLIYLDAAYAYAFYDPSSGNLMIDALELRKKIDRLVNGTGSPDPRPLVADLLQSVPQFESDLQKAQENLQTMPAPPKAAAEPPEPEVPYPLRAIPAGMQKYTSVDVPVLAIFADPHAFAGLFENDPAGRAKAEAEDSARIEAQAKAVEKEAPSSHVVRVAHATHNIFMSNEADVLREINSFMGNLPAA